MKKVLSLAIAALLLQSAAFADTPSPEMMDMLKQLQNQMSRMQSTIDAQNARIAELESSRAQHIEAPQSPAQTQAATMTDADFQKGIKDNIGEALPWLKGAKFGGDFRLRYEAFDFYDQEASTAASDRSRNRFRIRLRWGFEKDYGDDWKVGFRLATGPEAAAAGQPVDNTSTNQTLGDHFNYKSINIDRAYVQYAPNGLKDYGMVKGVSIGAGKFDNPFLRYSTTITWDSDVTPEGAYEKGTLNFVSTENNNLNFNGTLGQFIVNEGTAIDRDTFILGYQAGLDWSTYAFGTERPVVFATAASYYDYIDFDTTLAAANNTAATAYQRTNTNALREPAILDFYNEVVFDAAGKPLTLWTNFVENRGPFEDRIVTTNPIHDEDNAWGVGFKYGKLKAKRSWEAFYGYYEIGANAVVAAFNDSDFGGPGGNGFTNREGHKFGMGYQLTDAISVNWTGYLVKPMQPVAATVAGVASADESVFRSQLDAVYKF